MTPVIEQILAAGALRDESPHQAMRHHLLEGLLRRLARCPHARSLVVRGGLMTRAWVGQRATRDLDMVGDYPFDIADTHARLQTLVDVPVDDAIGVDGSQLQVEGIWLDSEFPGVRGVVPMEIGGVRERITLDIGFGDPLVPDAVRVDYPTLLDADPPRIWACQPETQVAWKLHGLAEFEDRFRPKDLADLYRITHGMPLDTERLVPAIEAAFLSRHFTLDQARGVLLLPHWRTKTASVRWRKNAHLPELRPVLDHVYATLQPAIERLAR